MLRATSAANCDACLRFVNYRHTDMYLIYSSAMGRKEIKKNLVGCGTNKK